MSKGTWARVRAQLGAWKADRAAQGTRAASVHRARQALDLGPVTTGRVDGMSHQIDELCARTEGLEARSDELGGAVERAAHEAQRATKAAVAASHDDETAVLLQRVVALAAWLDAMPPQQDVLISIVLPTCGARPEHLARAMASVRGQQHERWELLVVVDGSDERWADVTAQLPDDERVRVVRPDASGVSAARNAGLDAARGDLVAYLDDDNVMGPAWLRAISWAADRHPDDELFYGAQVVGDGAERGGRGALPTVHLAPFDRDRLRRGNYIDQNVLAHRRTLVEAHYDESIAANVDWDFLLRATASRDPVVVPAIASVYGTDAADRLTGSAEARESWPIVHERAQALRPLRVLAVNREYPHLTETYIHDDLHALEVEGAEIACYCLERRPVPIPNPYPFYDDLDRAIAEFEPDVLLTHWAAFVRIHHEQIAGKGVPFVVRPHSFSAERDAMIELLDDPRCLAVFAPAHFGLDHPKAKQLPVLFTRAEELPPPAATRDLVLSVSAGLPKKDFPVLLEAFGKLQGVERRMILGTSSDHETYPGEVIQLAKAMLDDPPLIQMNLTRDQVFEQLARAAAFVYVLRPEAGFSCPIGVIEAMASGVPVIMPERPEVHETFGAVRTYRTADDIVDHARTLLAGGPLVEAERDAARAFALETFCSVEDRKRFHADLVEVVERSSEHR